MKKSICNQAACANTSRDQRNHARMNSPIDFGKGKISDSAESHAKNRHQGNVSGFHGETLHRNRQKKI